MIHGHLDYMLEQGMEGCGLWIIQDENWVHGYAEKVSWCTDFENCPATITYNNRFKFPHLQEFTHADWRGVYVLHEGDYLKILREDTGIYWEGYLTEELLKEDGYGWDDRGNPYVKPFYQKFYSHAYAEYTPKTDMNQTLF